MEESINAGKNRKKCAKKCATISLLLSNRSTKVMATYYKYFDTRRKKSKVFPLKVAISHRSKRAYISTGYKLSAKEWDSVKEKIQPPYKNAGSANAKVNKKYAIVGDVVESLRPYWKQLSVDQLKEAVEVKIKEEFEEKLLKEAPELLNITNKGEMVGATCLYEYARKIIGQYYLNDKGGSAFCLENTVRSLKKYTGKKHLYFKQIDEDFLLSYERWWCKQLNSKGELNTINGFGFRAKDIRLLFNRTIKDKEIKDVTEEMYCFGRSGYSIKKVRTNNRNVDPSEIAKIFDLELAPEANLWHHLNYFKYYFECWGMNWADIAFLRVYQVQNGRLKYGRRKTKWSNNAKRFDIEHSITAQKIVDHYIKGKKPSDFVFPVISDIYYLNDDMDVKEQETKNKRLFQKKFNERRSNHIRRLKSISKKAGLKNNVSIYVGRHSFFSIALKSGVSKSVISEIAGHADYKTTESYLDGFSNEQLTESASMVRDAISSQMKNNVSSTSQLLDKLLIVSSTGKSCTVMDFLKTKVKNNGISEPSELLMGIINDTECKNGIKAQEYVDAFIKEIGQQDNL